MITSFLVTDMLRLVCQKEQPPHVSTIEKDRGRIHICIQYEREGGERENKFPGRDLLILGCYNAVANIAGWGIQREVLETTSPGLVSTGTHHQLTIQK
ncbi:hypothetical protein DPEC_G00106160 [Dallia pectoralis]|uniref:Uncharacterized protein n=1 Tax=Dallia pectoralis TaxID=75939 RepID=A0ACC2GYU9_DALPE|nr:hypothetical protein DPEC_G00106160 [Dallia pectoralis]